MKNRLLLACSLICISALAYSQLPNGGMESWSPYTSAAFVTVEIPDGWDTPDKIAADLGIDDPTVEKETTVINSGSAAAKLTTKTLNVLGTDLDVPGTMTTGTIGFDFVTFTPSVSGGANVSVAYESVEGSYRYSPAGADTMSVLVFMFLGTDTVGAGQYRDEATTTSYGTFSCPITYFAPVIPDKMQVIVTSSGGFTSLVAGSVLYVDDMSVTGGVAIDDLSAYGIEHNIYPNPASDHINIRNPFQGEVTMEVFNLNGQKVDEQILNADINSIGLENYTSGVYMFRLLNNGVEMYSNKFVVKK
ncbi:MAG: T9SS type A sorting domain-containing protein [Chitinophagales bacterium]